MLATVLATAVFARSGEAQISPGPLSRAHGGMEGNKHCFQCHGAGENAMTGQCLTCHAEIGRLVRLGRGLHAREGREACAQCHPEHAGRDFDLVSWGDRGRSGFEHSRTGWTLEAGHASLRCEQCHKSAFQDSSAFAGGPRRSDPGRSFLGLNPECRGCHNDPHAGRLGDACESCHRATTWRDAVQASFDHGKTRYPLRGAHAKVKCEACHDPKTAGGARPPFAECRSCHEDPHAGQASLAGERADCSECHDTGGFRPSTYTVARHRSSGYPLVGKHESVSCDRCHGRAAAGELRYGAARVNLRPAHGACSTCHTDAHRGQLASRSDRGACESCHVPAGWKPSTFDARAHAASGSPLEGGHGGAECSSCHGPVRRDLPAIPGEDVVGRARVWFAMGSMSECASCHQDPHAGRYKAAADEKTPSGCRTCHGMDSFRVTSVDAAMHERLGWPLDGAHGAVACPLCHEELARGAARTTLLEGGTLLPLRFDKRRERCADCHEDEHRGQFVDRGPSGCDACHENDAFAPASRFVHDRDSRFVLAGAHARVPCARCHSERRDERGAYTVYRPVSTECRSCHGPGGEADRSGKAGTAGRKDAGTAGRGGVR